MMTKPLFVRQHTAPIRWHEAVAVLRSVTDALEDGRMRSVPPAHELALLSDGSLYLTARAATVSADPVQVVAQLRELLQELLSWDAPPQLKAIAGDGAGGPAVNTLAEFRQAMAYFERPTIDADRRALAERLSTIPEEQQLETEVERLRRKAREEDTAQPATKASSARRKSLRKVLVALAILLGVGTGLGMAMFTVPAATGTGAAEGAEKTEPAGEKGILTRLKDAARSALGTAAPAEAKVTADAPALEVPRSRKERRPSAGLPSRPQPSLLSAAPPAVAFTEMRLLLPARVPAWSPPEFTLPEAFETVFSPADSDVAPPILVRPHLPSVGSVGLPGDQLGAVDVVVTADGRVEQVRLVRTTAERRYYDIMILAAVKAWVFRPASKSGEPVRYRLQIPLT